MVVTDVGLAQFVAVLALFGAGLARFGMCLDCRLDTYFARFVAGIARMRLTSVVLV
ncbi:hypothetical protein [Oceanobacillus salinisoli]|uniref:hypothetical protein n=1 Tax=Oceanobacillus salinisoli TaxID=2678611 RepID=UPI0012E10F92|nr:hypothetical protein [Oceanobacillus salinisoli]